MKSLLTNLPEIYFIGLGSAWALENFYSGNSLNYIALLIVWLLFLQLIYKNRLAGILYSNLLGFFSIYMLFGLYAEFKQFEAISENTTSLQTAGVFIFGLGVIMAGRMLYKYLTTKKNYEDNALTVSF